MQTDHAWLFTPHERVRAAPGLGEEFPTTRPHALIAIASVATRQRTQILDGAGHISGHGMGFWYRRQGRPIWLIAWPQMLIPHALLLLFQ
jgi:hypothetical protein